MPVKCLSIGVSFIFCLFLLYLVDWYPHGQLIQGSTSKYRTVSLLVQWINSTCERIYIESRIFTWYGDELMSST